MSAPVTETLAVGVPAIRVGDIPGNTQAALRLAAQAAAGGARVLALPALCLTSATAADLLHDPTFCHAAEKALLTYIRESAAYGDLWSFPGLPVRHEGKTYLCTAVVQGGRLHALVAHPFGLTSLPVAGRLYATFAPPPPAPLSLTFAGTETVITAGYAQPLYPTGPTVAIGDACGHILVIPGIDATLPGHKETLRAALAAQNAGAILLYAEPGEGESGADLVYDGYAFVLNGEKTLAECPPFSGEICRLITAEVATGAMHPAAFSCKKPEAGLPPREPFLPVREEDRPAYLAEMLTMQAVALAGRYTRAHANSLVIGISGGLDSTLALLVAVRAVDRLGLGRERILAVTMPCFGTTGRTRGNAEKLCTALGVRLRLVDIHAAVRLHFADIGHAEDDRSVVYENAQARERTQILMDLANAEGGLVVGTGDLSELALGWATYNGDHMSMYAVNAGVPKTMVRHAVRAACAQYEADGQMAVVEPLADILETPVSPELLPPAEGEIAQITEDLVGPYALHDYFLYAFVRCGMSPAAIRDAACHAFADTYAPAEVEKWLRTFFRRFFTQQFKRSCMPDGPAVLPVSLSPRAGFYFPSDAVGTVYLADLEEA